MLLENVAPRRRLIAQYPVGFLKHSEAQQSLEVLRIRLRQSALPALSKIGGTVLLDSADTGTRPGPIAFGGETRRPLMLSSKSRMRAVL
jgi:hypothetical protein